MDIPQILCDPPPMKSGPSLLLLLLAACGPAKTDTTPPHAEGPHDHGDLPPEVKGFHEVLAPRWHAEQGEARVKDTCAATPDFQTRAGTLVQLAPPAGADAARWSATTQELRDAAGALDAACKGADPAAFEPAFHRMHEAFHAVMEAAGAAPHKPEDGHHG